MLLGGKPEDLGALDGTNQWPTLMQNAPTTRETILLNIDENENSSGIIGDKGRYKLINGKSHTT